MKLIPYAECAGKPCEPVKFIGSRPDLPRPDTLEAMEALCREKNGIGLAAPQVGIFRRFFLLDFRRIGGGFYWVFNPEMIVLTQKRQEGIEGCLTVPGEHFRVTRFASVKLWGKNEDGTPFAWSACKGLFGRAVQHEMHHLEGRCVKGWAEKVKEAEDAPPVLLAGEV